MSVINLSCSQCFLMHLKQNDFYIETKPSHPDAQTNIHRFLEVRAGNEAEALLLGLMPRELWCHRSPILSLVLTPDHIFILTKKKKKSLNDLTCIVIKWSHHFALQIVPAPIVTLRFNHTPELWIVLCCGVSSCWSFPQLKYFSNYYMFISKHQRKSLLLYLNMKQWYLKKNKNFREGKRDSGDQISLTVFV